MQYKLIGKNNIILPLETVLKNRNIDKSLFNLTDSVIEDYNNFDNIEDGIKLLLKHINNKSKIVMIIDCDVDGHSSFAILYNYIKRFLEYDNLYYIVHEGKQHGLSNDIVIKDDVGLVIVPDAGSNDFKQHKSLKNRGIETLIIDHHDCDKGYSPYAIVINNQLSNKIKNKNSSGAFVVYKFVKALDNYLFGNLLNEYSDLNMWGNIADVINLHEKETRYYVYEGLKNINNLFLKALIEIKSYELESKLNINSIGWTLSPLVNATVRSGSHEEKLKMVEAFVSDDYDFCLETANMCKTVKARQDSTVKSALKKIELKISLKKEDRCIILNVGETLNKSHTGLVAGKIADKYKLPTLLYRSVYNKPNLIGGSFRGIDSISEDTRLDILNSGLVEFSEGHPNAGGWQCNKDNLDKLKEYLNDLYKDKDIVDGKEYLVDFILSKDEIDEFIINELAQAEDEFGNGIDIPLLLFKDIELNLTDKNLKGKLNIVFYINDIKFIKKFATNILKGEIINSSVRTNIIGKCTMDTYHNCGQVEVVEIEII